MSELKLSNPRKFYQLCKRIGAVDELNHGQLKVKCLDGLSDKESAEAVGQYMSSVSNEYEPVNHEELPAFLPALPPLSMKSIRCSTS